jgi:hypothetical protein
MVRNRDIIGYPRSGVSPQMGTILLYLDQTRAVMMASRSGPALVTDGLILREDHPPASAHQSLKPF